MDPEFSELPELEAPIEVSHAKEEKQVDPARSRLEQWQKFKSRPWRPSPSTSRSSTRTLPSSARSSTRTPPSSARFGLGGASGLRRPTPSPSPSPLSSALGAALDYAEKEADLRQLASGQIPWTTAHEAMLSLDPSAPEDTLSQSYNDLFPPETKAVSQRKSPVETPPARVHDVFPSCTSETQEETPTQKKCEMRMKQQRSRLLAALVGSGALEQEKEVQAALETSQSTATFTESFLNLENSPPPPQPPGLLESYAGQDYKEFARTVTPRRRIGWRFGGLGGSRNARYPLGGSRNNSFFTTRRSASPFHCLLIFARFALFISCGALLVMGSAQAGVGLWLLMAHSRVLHALLHRNVAMATLAALAGGGCHVALGGLTGIFSALRPSCCLALHMAVGASAAAGAVSGAMLEQNYHSEIVYNLGRHMTAEVESAKSHPFYELALHGVQRTFGCCGVNKFTEWCPATKKFKSAESNAEVSGRGKRQALQQSTGEIEEQNYSGIIYAQINGSQTVKRKEKNSPSFNLSLGEEQFITDMSPEERTLFIRHFIDQSKRSETKKRRERNDEEGEESHQKEFHDFPGYNATQSTVRSSMDIISLKKSGGRSMKENLDDGPQAFADNEKLAAWARANLISGPCPLPGSCCISNRDDSDCIATPPYTDVYDAGCLKPITALLNVAASVYRTVNITASVLLLFSIILAFFINWVIIEQD